MTEAKKLEWIKKKMSDKYEPQLSLAEITKVEDLMAFAAKIETGFRNKERNDERSKEQYFKPNKSRDFNQGTNNYVKRRFNAPRRNVNRQQYRPNMSQNKPNNNMFCTRCKRNNHFSKDCRAYTTLDGKPLSQATNSNNSKPRFVRGNNNYNPNNGANNRPSNNSQNPNTNLVLETIKQQKPEQKVEDVVTIRKAFCGAILKDDTTKATTYKKVPPVQHYFECNGEPILGMIDSGAANTLFNEEIANRYKWEIGKDHNVIVGVGSNILDVRGTVLVTISVTIGNTTKEITRRFTVIKNLGLPLLIGRDLRQKFNLDDRPDGTLAFRDSAKKPKGVRVNDEYVIPARSEYVIEGYTYCDGAIMFIPFKLNDNLIMANGIDNSKDGKVRILMANIGNKPIKLIPNMQIGSIEKIVEDPYKVINNSEQVNLVTEVENINENIYVGDELSEEQINELKDIIKTNAAAFSLNSEIGLTNLAEHKIELLPDAKPVAEPLRRRALVQIEETSRQTSQMLKDGIIEPSNSPWASAYALTRKKTGDLRLCIDFRRLNDLTKKSAYPLPNIEDCLDIISGMKYYTKLNFASGFWQIPMEESSRELTAFRTEDGLFQFKRMPFGLTNAPASFQKMMNALVAGMKGLHLLQVFIDDVCIATKDWNEHISSLEKFLKVVIEANLKLKATKCMFGTKKIVFLGHEISADGIRQDPEKLKALDKLPVPSTAKEVQRILGLLSYYR